MSQRPQYDLFVSYAEADREWVVGYLLDALEQAGINVHSEAAFALGEPRLLGFERAVAQSRRVLLVLSPAYLVDETTGFVAVLAQSYGDEVGTWPVIPLLLEPVSLPPRLAMLTGLDATDPAQREQVVARLGEELGKPVPGPAPLPPCPYPGMRPFAEADAPFFHGREDEAEDLVQRIAAQQGRERRFLAVIGPSGSGKSSLVFAGLVPKLRTSSRFGPGEWSVFSVRPGPAPMAAPTVVLGTDPPQPGPVFADLVAAPPEGRLLLVVDQFEELFTVARQRAPQDETLFQEAVLRLAERPGCFVILTVRADFYPDLMASPLWPQIQAHRAEVLPLGETGLRRAIVNPAEGVGVYVEAALVERLAADAAGEPGVLPLVQQTLVLLWERVERRFLPLRAYEALVLPRAAYGEAGPADAAPRTGLQVAVARHADATVAELDPEQQVIARRIFLRLVQPNEGRAATRRQRRVDELRSVGEDPARFAATLEHLAANRLLTLSGGEDAGGRTVDLAHEALIGGWPWLQQLVIQRGEAIRARQRLEDKTAEWVRLGRGRGGLLDEAELAEAERWLASPNAAELGYGEALPALVVASREELARELQRLRRRFVAAAAFGAVALVAALVALVFFRQAGEQRDRAEAEVVVRSTAEALARENEELAQAERATAEAARDQAEEQERLARSRQLAAQSISLADRQADLALLLSLEAVDVADSVEARSSLLAQVANSARYPRFLWGHAGVVQSVAFSPDGQTIAAAGCGGQGCREGEIRLWDVATVQPRGKPLIVRDGTLLDIGFSPDGQILAAGSSDGTVVLWDAASGQRRGKPLTGHPDKVRSIAFSPDGKTLAAGSCGDPGAQFNSLDCTGGLIQLWDLTTGRQRGEPLTGHEDHVFSVTFSPDGRTLSSGSRDGTVILWDVVTGQPRLEPLVGPTAAVSDVAFSPDGRTLAAGSGDGTVRLWEAATGRPQGEPLAGSGGEVRGIAFSPDGTTLAAGGCRGASELTSITGRLFCTPGFVLVWDVATGKPRDEFLTGNSEGVSSIAFGANSQDLAAGLWDGTVVLWDFTGRQQLARQLVGNEGPIISSVAFTPDSRTLATGSSEELVILWDVASGEQQDELLADQEGAVFSVAFSADGRTMTSGHRDGTVVHWHVGSGERRGEGRAGSGEEVLSMALSSDGSTLAWGYEDGTVDLVDTVTGEPLRGEPLAGSMEPVESIAFSSDGQTLAAGHSDGTVILWDVDGRQQLAQPLSAPASHVTTLAFSRDGRTLAAGYWNGTIILWDVSIESWKAQACARANRNLSGTEWRRYLGAEPYRLTCRDLPPGEGVPGTPLSSATPAGTPIATSTRDLATPATSLAASA